MKNMIVLLLLSTSLFTSSLWAESNSPRLLNPIRIAHPTEKAQLPAISSTFVYGSAPPAGELRLNGTPVTIHPGGGFLAMVNLSPGEFQIVAELRLNGEAYHSTRTIFVAKPQQPSPVSPLTIEYVTPRLDQELLPGDYVEIICKGSPGAKAHFTVEGVRKAFPLIESDSGSGGIYRGVYRIGNKDRLKKSRIKVTLVNDKYEKESMESEGTLSLFSDDAPAIFEVSSPDAILFAGPAISPNDRAGYLMYPPVGTRIQATGRIGDEYRIRLSHNKTAWVNMRHVRQLPEGTPPARVVVGSITVGTTERSTIIRIPLAQKIPYQVVADGEGKYIDLMLFGAYSNTDWIINAASGVIRNIGWHQDEEEIYRLRIDTIPNSWWGYDARYEGRELVLELRTPPPVLIGHSPLYGLTIAIDPGHSADTGAIGPTGYMEKDANLAQALVLRDKLAAKGAHIVMIREGNEDVPLRTRPKIAWQNRADLLLSIHNNSLGYGGNPLVRNGFGVYYYTPMSLPLAREIHAAYAETFRTSSEFRLRDDGLYYANLAMTRSPQMPAVLIESAYIIVPEEEAYLKTDGFRIACADAIISGLERYARRMRPVKR